MPKVIPSSPEAGALGKYAEWPVSMYTGVPNINIPLYSIKIQGVDLPIGLNYHSGGVKVDDISSWTGVGWSLSAGGAITRTVVGLPDESTEGFLSRNKNGQYIKPSYNLSTSPDDYVLLKRISGQQVDVEPDLFYFNFGNKSGKFYFDQAGNFRSIPASSLKLVSSPIQSLNPSAEWRIADEDGTLYCFGSPADDWIFTDANGLEATWSAASSSPQLPQAITAWYLTKIISTNKADTIYFDYAKKSEVYILPATQSLKILTNPGELSSHVIKDPVYTSWDDALRTRQTLYNGDPVSQQTVQRFNTIGFSSLKKIRWRQGQIDIVAQTSRSDMQIGYLLDSVLVKDKASNRLQAFALNYSYIGERYYLNALDEFGADNAEKRTHTFSYLSPGNLPKRNTPAGFLEGKTSNAQDHWGFYNGRDDNTSLLPYQKDMPSEAGFYLKANREPDTTRMQYGTLQQIIYPTGGYSVFEFEAHRYIAEGTVDGGPSVPIVQANIGVRGNVTPVYANSVDFTIPFNQQASLINVSVNNYAFPPNANKLTMAWFPYVKIERVLANGTVDPVKVYYWDPSYRLYEYPENPTPGNPPANPAGLYDFQFNLSKLLSPGNYRITASDSCLGPGCFDILPTMPSAYIGISYLKYDGAPQQLPALPIAGGLRIKKILNYEQNGQLLSGKTYSYDPGKLLIYPSYFSHYENDVADMAAPGNFCNYLMANFKEVSSNSQYILGFTQGSPVGYEHVTERSINSGDVDNGYTDYTFSFSKDSLNMLNFDMGYWSGMSIYNASVPVTGFDYKRGLLLSKTEYRRNTNGTYTKLRSTEHNYSFNDYNTSRHYNRLRNLRVKTLRNVNYPCGTPLNGYTIPSPTGGKYSFSADFAYAFYHIITGWVEQQTVKETVYTDGNNPIVHTTNYFYDNPLLLNPSRIVQRDSKGSSIVQTNSYAYDYAAGTPFIDAMVNNYITGIPIEQVQYQTDASGNSIITGGKITTFKPDGKNLADEVKILSLSQPLALSGFKFSNTTQGSFPISTPNRTVFSPDNRYETDIINLTYDIRGNILEQQLKNNVTHSFLWGYDDNYPVAEVVGANYSTVANMVNLSVLKAPSGDQQLRNEINKIRNATTSNAVTVTTYTYRPLIGISSKVAPNGLLTSYEYDPYHRLKLIRDQNGKILKQMSYQYRVPVQQ
ncbi:hypothetical protein [Chitinophaga sp. MD30]|uniref:hypothetical protein n=1 Tax=Chitinophaga sp. MD30 TaxID=2033437 RepID=UPI000BAFE8ED|nr:hypothetical protein [Chitinophaga sp. MD30]ASZ14428.1 hypothetical protein CK934_27530 [Chitinophaga sp. MD30]